MSENTEKEVVISNSKLNSYGFRVLTSGIDITQYMRNPILLYMHDRWRYLPIGTVKNIRIDGDNIIGTPVFDEADEFSRQIKAKWDAGTLRMFSAGVDPIERSGDPMLMLPGQTRPTVSKGKLVEISIVDIGANDDAIVLYNDNGIIKLGAGLDSFLPLISEKSENEHNLKNQNMKLIALKLGLPESASENEILQKISSLQADAQAGITLKTELETVKNNQIGEMVTLAITQGKITADKKDHFVQLGKSSGLESLKATLDLMKPAVKPMDVIVDGKTAAADVKLQKGMWDYSEAELKEMRENDRDSYCRLYRQEYGVNPDFD